MSNSPTDEFENIGMDMYRRLVRRQKNYTTQKGERMTEMTHGGRREEDGDTRRKRK